MNLLALKKKNQQIKTTIVKIKPHLAKEKSGIISFIVLLTAQNSLTQFKLKRVL